MSELSYPWLVTTLDASTKVILLAGITMAASCLLRIRDSHLRHRLWVGVLFGMLLIPVASPLVPALRVPLALHWSSEPSYVTRNVGEDAIHSNSPNQSRDSAEQPHIEAGATSQPDVASALPLEEFPLEATDDRPAATTVIPDATSGVPTPRVSPSSAMWATLTSMIRDWSPLLLVVWLAGVALMLSRLLFGLLAATRVVRRSTFIDADDLTAIGVANEAIQSAALKVYECAILRVPVTVGVFQPRVLLPVEWVSWSNEKLQSVLAHEIAHARRRDAAITVVAGFNRAIYWFHPMSWWLKSKLADLAESACDDEAIDVSGDRTGYARHLLEVAARVAPGQSRLMPNSVSMARHSIVESRIDAILDYTRPLSQQLSRTTATGVLALVIALIGLLAAVKPRAQADDATANAPFELADDDTISTRNADATANAPATDLVSAPQGTAEKPPANSGESAIPQSPNVAGRVVDESGRPVAAAQICAPQLLRWPPASMNDLQVKVIGTSREDGRFRVDVPENPIGPKKVVRELFIFKPGLGLNWITLKDISDALEVVLNKESLITGQLLSTEGLPITDAKISVTMIARPKVDKTIDDLIAAWKKEWNIAMVNTLDTSHSSLTMLATTTDENGQFSIRGVPIGWVAALEVEAEGHAQTPTCVFNSKGLDAPALNKAARSGTMISVTMPTIQGPQMTLVCEPELVVTGRVVNADDQPIEGIMVQSSTGYNSVSLARTDADGIYRLDGLRRGNEALVSFNVVNEESTFLPRTFGVTADAATATKTLDVTLKRGIVVNGSVTEANGKQVEAGSVRFVPLPSNKFSQQSGFDGYQRSRVSHGFSGGKFRLVVIPGPGVLMLQAHGDRTGPKRLAYQQVNLTEEQRTKIGVTGKGRDRRFTSAGNTLEFLSHQNAIKYVDFDEGSGPHEVELSVSRGKSVEVNVVDENDKPVPDVFVSGVTEDWPLTAQLKEPTCTVQGLGTERPRKVLFLHRGRNLAGAITLTGDERSPVSVRLRQSATIRGKALDASGEPIAGLVINTNFFNEYASELYRFYGEELVKATTDSEGRFEINDIVPGEKFNLDAKFNGDTIRAQAKPELIEKLGFQPDKSVRRLAAPGSGEHEFGPLLFGPPFGKTLPWPN